MPAPQMASTRTTAPATSPMIRPWFDFFGGGGIGGAELRRLRWLARIPGTRPLRGRWPAPGGDVRVRLLPSVRRVTVAHVKPLSLSTVPRHGINDQGVVSAANRGDGR